MATLVKVKAGLYTSQSGSITVIHESYTKAGEWLVIWKTVLGGKMQRRFPTLSAVRQWYREGGKA
jgi:hypothetical protein